MAGRPRHEFSDEDVTKIEAWSEIGVPVKKMAAMLGCGARTIERHAEDDERIAGALERGRAVGDEKLLKTAFHMATEQKDKAVLIFLLKTRLGMKAPEDQPEDKSFTVSL